MIKIFNKLIFKKKEDKLKKLSVENVIKDFNCKTNLLHECKIMNFSFSIIFKNENFLLFIYTYICSC